MQEQFEALADGLGNAVEAFEGTIIEDIGGAWEDAEEFLDWSHAVVAEEVEDVANESTDIYSVLWNVVRNQLNVTTTEAEREEARLKSYVEAGLNEQQQKIAEGFFELYDKPIELTTKTASELGSLYN